MKSLEDQIREELADTRYQHGRPIGYARGCRGPVCKMVNRARQRKQRKSGGYMRDLDAMIREIVAEVQSENESVLLQKGA